MSTPLYNKFFGTGSTNGHVPELSAEVLTVTPQIAQEMLSKNTYERQRFVRPRKVDEYADAMIKGRFEPGTQISFGVVGQEPPRIMDGQHRLRAVIKSGKPQMFVIRVVRYQSEEHLSMAYGHFDQHAKRSVSDNLRAIGIDSEYGLTTRQTRHLTSALKDIYVDNFGSSRHGKPMPIEDVRGWIDEYIEAAELYWDITAGAPQYMRSSLDRSATMSVALVTAKHSVLKFGETRVRDFWLGVAHDDGLSVTDPRKVANRHLLTAVMASGNGKGQRVSTAYSSRYIANCWNAWAEQRSIRVAIVKDQDRPIRITGSPFTG
jgi:hypothetical protein